MGETEIITILKDWGLVLAFAAVFLFLVRRMMKNSPPAAQSAGAKVAAPSVQAQKPGNYAEITAAISAAINEYRKNNQ